MLKWKSGGSSTKGKPVQTSRVFSGSQAEETLLDLTAATVDRRRALSKTIKRNKECILEEAVERRVERPQNGSESS